LPRQAAYTFSAVAGISMCAAVGDRVHDGERAGRARLAHALDVQRIGEIFVPLRPCKATLDICRLSPYIPL
jgi:hypothetical protein